MTMPSPERVTITYMPAPPRESELPPADELPEGWTTVTALKAELAGKAQPAPEDVSRRIDEYIRALVSQRWTEDWDCDEETP